MPVKSKTHKPYHVAHKKEKRTKRFMKVYAPYIPLLLIVACGLFVGSQTRADHFDGAVQSYATNTTDEGLLKATNAMRAAEGLQPLTHNTSLDQAAQAKAIDMSNKNYWSHISPDGRQPWDFINDTKYSYRKAAENLAFGFETSETTVKGWMNSPGHRANILDPALREVGFGIINNGNYQDHGPETIVVAMYAQPSVAGDNTVSLPVSTAATTPASSASPQRISYIQSITAGKAPWSTLVIGMTIGLITMYLLIKHARVLRRTLRKSERFIVHHPLLDITLVALIILAALVSQTIGTIY